MSDHLALGVKIGPPLVQYVSNKNPYEGTKKEMSEVLSASFSNQLHDHVKHSGSYFHKFPSAMTEWRGLWNARNIHSCVAGPCPPAWFPVASQSSFGPRHPNTTCAIFTIVYNEPIWLPIWIRYYSRHANLNDIWVLDHNTNDNSTSLDKLPQGIRHLRVRGNAHFSPHFWLNRRVELQQQRLLRFGYKCVLFTEVDEFVVPDPIKFPGGLREYLLRFAGDNSSLSRRTNGYHVLENRNPNEGIVDSRINWSLSLLSQRHTWATAMLYSKPLLTKFPLKYIPGFHNTSERDWEHSLDQDLYLLHMSMIDVDYCIYRHAKKASLVHRKPKNEKFMGTFRNVTVTECLTSTFADSKAVVSGPPHQMPSHWKLIEI